ncbi:N-acetylglucosamine-6-phosphate deacetylase [Sphingomonas vulcanisoli]|uniref:N-acetylglucosamine-6-phosphate deacetylase n=1 Tax=Sphingomonas vulcanisoli TaxID=1658060 RepID=A0ABX0TMI0_9SPHN|nr:N-acetylglucosamine-6-phosphate deacetylase [Sphingomonas vulcanisoli]NIJ06729.1 N-acetylglucosamine-6-phosphate deacetylase [Sphingomonas vulcanisoli]
MSREAITGATLVLPNGLAEGQALLIENGRIVGWTPASSLSADWPTIDMGGGWLAPGFIDVQVNGGGDVLLNDAPTVEGIRKIAEAHRRFGTTGLLPTLISDHVPVIDRAIAAIEQSLADGISGVLGLHIEGPHLNPAKKGIHDDVRFAPIDGEVLARLTRPTKGVRLVTLAPELAPAGAIAQLRAADVLVAAGHSLADFEQTRAALADGLCGFTHLFNAMTQLGSREPGMVGAALIDRGSHFGLIVDGLHVHPATLRIAINARGMEGAMLVTDAMPPVGGVKNSFTLMGQPIQIVDGTCRGPDGTLAGSALSMAQAFRNAMDMLGCTICEASRMASGNPATFLRLDNERGSIAPGLSADLVHLDAQRRVTRTWIAGDRDDNGE